MGVKKGDLVFIRWMDARAVDTNWINENEIKQEDTEPAICESVGFLVQKTKKSIVIAQDRLPTKTEKHINGLSVIPTPWAQVIIKLEIPEEKKHGIVQ